VKKMVLFGKNLSTLEGFSCITASYNFIITEKSSFR